MGRGEALDETALKLSLAAVLPVAAESRDTAPSGTDSDLAMSLGSQTSSMGDNFKVLTQKVKSEQCGQPTPMLQSPHGEEVFSCTQPEPLLFNYVFISVYPFDFALMLTPFADVESLVPPP